MRIIGEFSQIFNFLRIFEPSGWRSSKRMFEFVLPVFAYVSVFFGLHVIEIPIRFTCSPVLIGFAKSFLAGMFPVSLAVLTAVAAISNKELDKEVRGDGAYLTTMYHGEICDRKISRRFFICSLFGYISFISIILYLFIYFIPERFLAENLFFDYIAFSFFLILFFHYLSVVIFGIFLLTARIVDVSPIE